jgi:hypothetical protein
MKGWLRKARGILGTGLVWGAVGTVLGAVGGLIGFLVDPAPLGEWMLGMTLLFGGFGAVAGAGFAAALAAFEGRSTLGDLTPGRAAVWGGAAGFVIPLGLVAALSGGALPLLPAIASATAFGGATALLGAGTVHIARSRAEIEARDPELLEISA